MFCLLGGLSGCLHKRLDSEDLEEGEGGGV